MKKKVVFAALGGVAVIGFIMVPPKSTSTKPAAIERSWHLVNTWAGIGNLLTESFEVPSGDFRVIVKDKPAAEFSVLLLDAAGSPVADVMSIARDDTAYVNNKRSGYHLQVKTPAQARWTVTVERR